MACLEDCERTCYFYPRCHGCDSYYYWKEDPVQNSIKENNKTKESKVMQLSDIKIVVGGKAYAAMDVNWIQTPGEFPRIEASTYVSPINAFAANRYEKAPIIKDVIFNPPATIVFWSDKTKTVVKCDYEYETYDPEKGIAMAIAKKMMGDNKYEYYNTFLHWMKKWEKQKKETPNAE